MNRDSQHSSGMADDSTDDSDSLTLSSTPEDSNSQNEWTVTKILAEANVGGVQKYLIEWTDFPLCDATWEPAENLSEELLNDWKAAVKETGRTTVPGFSISDWRKAVNADIRAQYAKHEERNRKRARLGLEQRPLQFSLQDWLDSVHGPDEDEDNDGSTRRDRHLSQAKTTREEETSGTDSAGPRPSKHVSKTHHHEPQVSRTVCKFNGPQQENASPSTKVRRSSGGSPEPSKGARNKSMTSSTNLSEILRRSSNSVAARPARHHSRESMSKAFATKNAGSAASMSALNVFVGGKQRKPRRNLLDVVSNPPGESSKLFNYHKRWVIEKGRRDKEGVTPPNIPGAALPLMPIRGRTSSDASITLLDDGKSDEVLGKSDQSPLSEPSGPKKKRVRWAEDLEDERPEPMEDLESLFVSDGEDCPKGKKTIPLSPSKGDKWVASTSSSSPGKVMPTPMLVSENTSKICQFGPTPEISVRLCFSGWTTDDESPWSRHLQKQPNLLFSHLCTMPDLRSQTAHGKLEDVTVCQGNIEADDESKPFLQSLAKRLQVGQLVVVCFLGGISIAVHVLETSAAGDAPSSDIPSTGEPIQLHYFIFVPDPPVSELMLAPLPPFAKQERGLGAYQFFLGDTFEKLFRNGTTKGTRQNFFLVFPQTSYQEAVMLSQWLRASDSSCTIRTSLIPGQWSEFILLDEGTVILHEDAIWAIRSIPHLGSILHGHIGKMIFWIFSRSSLQSTGNELTPAPTDYRLHHILRSGIVVLVTPSFLVSQPEQAYNFFKFFCKAYTSRSSIFRAGRLAVVADIPGWLAELAFEKAEEPSPFSKSGISARKRAKASEALRKSFGLLRKLIEETEDDVDSPFIYAPDILDGNDEQSLVNWFGSWTVCHNRQFRKLFVLGSSNQSETRLSRNLRPVQFAPLGENDGSEGRMGPLQPRDTFDSDVARIRETLMDIERGFRTNPIVLYKFPVIQKGPAMASQQMGPDTMGQDDYARWFTFFAAPFFGRLQQIKTKGYVPVHKNTFVGFFFTTGYDQPANRPTDPHQMTWSPWIAIYRPSDIQLRPWRSMDLLIWDPNPVTTVPESEDAYEEDLSGPQRQLLHVIGEKTRDTEGALPLGQVWLGPVGNYQGQGRGSDLDRALCWVEELSSSFKQWLPIAKSSLGNRGWKPVSPGSRPASNVAAKTSSLPMDLDSPSSPSLPVRAILPPPGTTVPSQATPNRNFFRDAILGHRGPGPIPFTFQPTMKWYTAQAEAGSGFQHIVVSTWQSIFTLYDIDDPEKEGD
ncbi:hypothetical protein E4U41_007234 [Claviceps citrina]|nr:hypothetical protein E4U41_007234 [Claviceps citrina]